MKKILPSLHAILLFGSLASPFWADWKIVLIGFSLYILQKILLKGCILSFAQFGSKEGRPKDHFTPYYLKKFFGLSADDHKIVLYLDYVVAPIVPIFAIIIQVVFHYSPAIKF